MRLTIDRSLTDAHDIDLEAVPGVTVAELLAGASHKRAWCGPEPLATTDRVGTFPLLHGARLRDGPGLHTCAPTGIFLAVIAGPDAGATFAVTEPMEIGSAPGRHCIRDDAMDPSHLRIEPREGRALVCSDGGSTNGTGWWRMEAGQWRWRGRRRRFTALSGDVIVAGATALQVRWGGTEEPRSPTGRWTEHAQRLVDALRRTSPPPWIGTPDPTSAAGWGGRVHLTGSHSRQAARAVILARGRRPPSPEPFDEPWLRWLPDPLPSDGVISCGSAMPGRAEVTWEAQESFSIVHSSGEPAVALPVAVSETTADCLARSVAAHHREPWPQEVRWADVDSEIRQWADSDDVTVALGLACSDASAPWTVTLDPTSPHLLAAGAPGTGLSTLLATLVGAVAHARPTRPWSVRLIGTAPDGPLAPLTRLPHVTHVVDDAAGPDGVHALRAASELAVSRREALLASGAPTWRAWEESGDAPGRVLMVVDDFDLVTGPSREAAAALESLVAPGEFVGIHVALATHRPAGAITPALRASCRQAVALRAASESDSLGIIGVVDAAALAPSPGRGIAMIDGHRSVVHVALPLADHSPRVRPAHLAPPAGRHLVDAVLAHAAQDGSFTSSRP